MQLRSKQLTLSAVLVAGTVFALTGCGSGGIPPAYNPGDSGSGSGSNEPVVSNNWELTMTASTPGTTGSLSDALQLLSGSIETQGSDVRAVFRATTKGCFSNATVIPLLGSGTSSSFTATSFNIKGQYLDLKNGTYDSSRSNIKGNYALRGGCSEGESGSFTGVRFDALTGTYTGNLSTGASSTTPITVTLAQSTSPTGEGTFILTGTVSATGFACFPSGTLAAGTGNGSVSGSRVLTRFAASTSGGGTLSLNGTVTTDVKTLTLTPVITGTSTCNGTYGAVTLTRQQ